MRILLMFFLLSSSFSFGQLISGTLMDEGRPVMDKPSFIIEGTSNGYAKFELAVDRKGVVTSVRQVESNLKSTPAKYQLKNYAKKFKFKPGTYYPKFHHVIVKLTIMSAKEN